MIVMRQTNTHSDLRYIEEEPNEFNVECELCPICDGSLRYTPLNIEGSSQSYYKCVGCGIMAPESAWEDILS